MEEKSTRICVPVSVRKANELTATVARAAEVADLIELRLDCLEGNQLKEVTQFLSTIEAAVIGRLILTFRPHEQGGRRSIDQTERLGFWLNSAALSSGYVDIERTLLTGDPPDVERLRNHLGQARIICSHHDFDGLPPDLEQIYEQMAATEARILKIAVQADDATDCLPVFKLLERAQKEQREVIAIAMGEAGIMTRILGPSRGAFLTYGSLDVESATAEGQLTAKDLREVYRIDQINQQTSIMGVVGSPVAHSLSPEIHNAALAAAHINGVYIPFEVRDAGAFMKRMVHPRSREVEWNLRGLSVTAPHKKAVMNHLDWIEPAAKEIGAVNTVVVNDEQLHGYNTDAPAFITPLRERLGSLKDLRCAIVGAGGAARSAIWALKNEQANVSVFARDRQQREALTKEFAVDCRALSETDFAEFDIVVNATPAGTRGTMETETVARCEQLRGVRLVYDLVYNPCETRLMREARAAGCEVLGGMEMLIAQAVEQFKLWIGADPDPAVMQAAAKAALLKA